MATPYRLLAISFLPLLRWRIQRIFGLENLPKSGGFILVANHQSWIDSAILGGAVYRDVIKGLKYVAQSSKYINMGGIPINEYDKSQVIDIALGYLQAGHPVVIFPEGNSNRNPELRSGRTGAARLALRSGLPVVPVGIHGTMGVKSYQAMWWFIRFWRPCRVTIGQPLSFPKQELTGQDQDRLMTVTDEIMRAISRQSGKKYADLEPAPVLLPNQSFFAFLLWRIVAPLLVWRVRITGEENIPTSGAFIVAGNHPSYFEAPALSLALFKTRKVFIKFPTKPSVAKAFQRLISAKGIGALGMLPINPTNRSTVLESAIAYLNSGGVIGIFPEGTRNKPAINPNWRTELLKGKTGAVRLWLATKAPIIPVGIHAPRGIAISEALLNLLKFWQPVRLKFGAPVEFSNVPGGEPTKNDLDSLTRILMRRIGELCSMKYNY